jgi:hypothetical protein
VLKDKLDPQTIQTVATTLLKWMSKEKDADALESLANGLHALKEKVDPQTIQTVAIMLVERMSKEKDADALGFLAFDLDTLIDKDTLRDKIDQPTAQELATTLVERMGQEKDTNALGSLAEGLDALMDKIDQPTAQKLATALVERVSKENDANALRSLGSRLHALRAANLPQKALEQVSGVFQIPDAPCSALLAFDRDSQLTDLPKQLRNPLCAEDDWRRLALSAASLTGRPIAREENVNGKERIAVDFSKLSDYVWSGQPWYERYRLSFPEVAALVLLVLTVIAFTLGLIKSRDLKTIPRN